MLTTVNICLPIDPGDVHTMHISFYLHIHIDLMRKNINFVARLQIVMHMPKCKIQIDSFGCRTQTVCTISRTNETALGCSSMSSGLLFNRGLQRCNCRSYLKWFRWQHKTLNSFRIVTRFILVNFIYLRHTNNVIFILSWMQWQVVMLTAFHRLTVSYIASYHSNGTPNISKSLCIPSIGPIALYMGQNTTDLWQKTLE